MKKIMYIVLFFILLWISMVVVDYFRIKKFEKPIFVLSIESEEMQLKKYHGLGYSVDIEGIWTSDGVLVKILKYTYRIFGIYVETNCQKYGLPQVYIEGNMDEMLSKADERNVIINYISNDIRFNSYARIKLQGASSLEFEKKNYNIKLYTDSTYKNKNKIDVGWGEQNKYCLKANWVDKTHARNIVTAELVSQIQAKYNILEQTPNNGMVSGYPVEIYINGKYHGLYTWNIPKDAWLLGMDEDNENHIAFFSEKLNKSNVFLGEAKYGEWTLEVGEENEANLQKLNEVINFVAKSDDDVFRREFAKYINLDAAINYVIMLQFAGLMDNISRNMLFATWDGKQWYPILYDLDNSWGMQPDGHTMYTSLDFIMYIKLWEKIIDVFPQEVYIRYCNLRESLLTKEYIMGLFNDFKNKIPQEAWEREKLRWKDIPGMDYSQIEEFLDQRIPMVDSYMEKLNVKR